jgi:hypothetical protein
MDEDDLYEFYIDGVKQIWECTCWYDGPLMYENEEKTHTMMNNGYTNQFELFVVYSINGDEYNRMVDELIEDKKNGKRRDKHGTDLLHDLGILPQYYYSMYNNYGELLSFDEDELRETNPEIFI